LLGEDSYRGCAFNIAECCIFLVEAKCQGKNDGTLTSYLHIAVSQAIALLKITRFIEITLSPITPTLKTVATKCSFAFQMVQDGFSVSSKRMERNEYIMYQALVNLAKSV